VPLEVAKDEDDVPSLPDELLDVVNELLDDDCSDEGISGDNDELVQEDMTKTGRNT